MNKLLLVSVIYCYYSSSVLSENQARHAPTYKPVTTPEQFRLLNASYIINEGLELHQNDYQNHITVNVSNNNSALKDNSAPAEQRFYYGYHTPNCPEQPHPPHYPVKCGGIYKGLKTEIISPGFPYAYPSFSQCTYKIIPAKKVIENACFRVSFVHFNIRWSPNCQQDYMRIDQGPPICGAFNGERYYRTSPFGLVINFKSQHIPGPPGSGFHLIITQQPCYPLQPVPPPNCPPNQKPPIYKPPIYKPPPYYPEKQNKPELWWKWIWMLKCQWAGADYLPPGKCPPPPPLPPPPVKPPYHPHPPTVRPPPPPPPTYRPPPPPPPPIIPHCNRVVTSPQFVITSDEWLPKYPPVPNQQWNCRLNIRKSSPNSCEVNLLLEGVALECATEFLLVGNQRICGYQPIRQMTIDFYGPEATIVYQNIRGTPPGRFSIKGYQNYDCEPFTLDVSLAKKIQQPPATTPMTPSN